MVIGMIILALSVAYGHPYCRYNFKSIYLAIAISYMHTLSAANNICMSLCLYTYCHSTAVLIILD